MRALRRPAVTPPSLNDPKLLTLAGTLAERATAASRDFPARWWRKPDVLGALYAMHGVACAYCGLRFVRSDKGDVEHFRPKTLYPYMAYKFENYLLSCGYCNQVRKRALFPLASGAKPFGKAQLAQLSTEPRLLLDPSADPVEDWMSFDWTSDVPWVVPLPVQTAGTPSAAERVEETVRFFWLNTSGWLVKERLVRKGELLQAIDEGAQERVRRLASRFVEHGAFVRVMVRAMRPGWLPSVQDEVRWLVEELALDYTLRKRAGSRRDLIEPPPESTRWALAYLWQEPPPPTTPAEVEGWLTAAGVVEEVRATFGTLKAAGP